jgi:hypothetical protein
VFPGKVVNGRQALLDPGELARIDVQLLAIAAQCPGRLINSNAGRLEQCTISASAGSWAEWASSFATSARSRDESASSPSVKPSSPAAAASISAAACASRD